MRRVLAIAGKDLRTAFRDPAAVIVMVLTPLALAFIFGLAFPGSSGTDAVRTVVVDLDGGQFGGQVIRDVLTSDDVRQIVDAVEVADPAEARRQVDANEASVAVIIPTGLSDRLTSEAAAETAPLEVELYANPGSTIGRAIVEAVVKGTLSRLTAGWAAANTAIAQLVAAGLLSPSDAEARAPAIAEAAAQEAQRGAAVEITGSEGAPASPGFDWKTYMGPSMAVMFLMFAVAFSARSLLFERDAGTLPRLLTTPTTPGEIMTGKMGGTYSVGLAQMAILIASMTLFFGLQWGSWPGVVVLTLALVFAATGWGTLIAAFARTTAQAGQAGTAIALIFAIMAGNFIPRQIIPEPIRVAGYITPNAWGLEGYGSLSAGGSLETIVIPVIGCLVMGVVLLAISTAVFRRRLVG